MDDAFFDDDVEATEIPRADYDPADVAKDELLHNDDYLRGDNTAAWEDRAKPVMALLENGPRRLWDLKEHARKNHGSPTVTEEAVYWLLNQGRIISFRGIHGKMYRIAKPGEKSDPPPEIKKRGKANLGHVREILALLDVDDIDDSEAIERIRELVGK